MTQNISLAVLEKTDLDFLHRLVNDPAIMNFWFEEAHNSKAQLEENYDKQKETQHSRGFILRNETDQLGFVALFSIDFIHRKAEFAIMMDPKQQGKGYAKIATKLAMDYAFLTLNLNKLYLIVDEVNEKAEHVYEKVGFKREGVLKDEYFVNGEYHNVVYMSIFQKDYLNK